MYGKCNKCNINLMAEYCKLPHVNNKGIETGKTVLAVNFLFCPSCFENFTVDDSFDVVL